MKRSATAIWNGSGKDGKGILETQSKTLDKTQYSYKSRFEEGTGTNPEELIAAAHAGCFSMKLSFVLGQNGFTPQQIETNAEVTLENGTITRSYLRVKASVPGLKDPDFQKFAQEAKNDCPVSKALKMEIGMEAALV